MAGLKMYKSRLTTTTTKLGGKVPLGFAYCDACHWADRMNEWQRDSVMAPKTAGQPNVVELQNVIALCEATEWRATNKINSHQVYEIWALPCQEQNSSYHHISSSHWLSNCQWWWGTPTVCPMYFFILMQVSLISNWLMAGPKAYTKPAI